MKNNALSEILCGLFYVAYFVLFLAGVLASVSILDDGFNCWPAWACLVLSFVSFPVFVSRVLDVVTID